jgi:diguanylate cyclase (GGDEF)-like protein
MDQSFLHKLATPGTLKPKAVLIASIVAMAVVFVIDVGTPPDIRLHMLYIFPMAAIALHCVRKSDVVAGLVISTTFQLLTFYIDGIPVRPFVIDAVTAFASALLSIFLGMSVRKNHLATVKLATTDWLTGLHNRRSFETIVDLEIERQKRYGGVFSLAVIDLDGFKKLNDSRGHHIGDKALQLLADALREDTRHSDSIARLGGDEFAILMPNTLKPDCSSLCQQLSSKIAGQMSTAGYPTTASIGCMTFENAPEFTSEALQKTDKAMYAAKTGGKNCVVCL